MEKTYQPEQIEQKWQEFWFKERLFHASETSSKDGFSIVIPPPNVTGSLHVGHALNNTLQDILCRYMRMQGKEVLWMPGTDHAGIATQNVVERQLKAEGKSRKGFGRDQFIERVWKWKEELGGQIINQLKRLGCSCDWDRERFTMDEGLSHAVRESFVRLYREGLIYRGDYMIQWCPRCDTALADLEVEYPDEPENGFIYRISYPLQNPGGTDPAFIVIETTRPETMLGDTAVAVHPDDPRYQALIGKKLVLPLVGRVIPIIADSFVDPEFGSGAVKITPGHDFNDFEAGRRHNLEIISVVGSDGKMTEQAGNFAGLDRNECRKQVLSELKKSGNYIAEEKHQLKIGRCYRCQTITEPLVSRQWFVHMKEMAQAAALAVQDGRTSIIPKSWEATYFQWLENIRDWCISRQLWWGHQIPIWYCDQCMQQTPGVDTPPKCEHCGSNEIRQDPDVLDTWFSSGLWPFSTMGWPEQTATLSKFYPTSVLVTGFDILFFWVARMMMMGLKFTHQVPFYDIYLHAMVRDEHGQKMSKTKGNVIDPLAIIDQFGADALRFTLAILTLQGRDINLSVSRINGYRSFVNKIWNAVRFVLLSVAGGDDEANLSKQDLLIQSQADVPSDLAGRWIRSRLARVIEENVKYYSEYKFSELCSVNYRFFWDEFCAWYLELAKLQLKEGPPSYGQASSGQDNERTKVVKNLVLVTDVCLRLFHPLIPFVTEELWSFLPTINGQRRDTLTRQPFPKLEDAGGTLAIDTDAERKMSFLQQIVVAIRTIRSQEAIPSAQKILVILEGEEQAVALVLSLREPISHLAKAASIDQGSKPDQATSALVEGVHIHVLIEKSGIAQNKLPLAQELKRLEDELMRVKGKLNNHEFLTNAPDEIVEKEKNKLKELEEKLALRQGS